MSERAPRSTVVVDGNTSGGTISPATVGAGVMTGFEVGPAGTFVGAALGVNGAADGGVVDPGVARGVGATVGVGVGVGAGVAAAAMTVMV